jgi:hypothetical protein
MLKEKKKKHRKRAKANNQCEANKTEYDRLVHRRHCRSLIKLNMIGDDDHGNFASLPV